MSLLFKKYASLSTAHLDTLIESIQAEFEREYHSRKAAAPAAAPPAPPANPNLSKHSDVGDEGPIHAVHNGQPRKRPPSPRALPLPLPPPLKERERLDCEESVDSVPRSCGAKRAVVMLKFNTECSLSTIGKENSPDCSPHVTIPSSRLQDPSPLKMPARLSEFSSSPGLVPPQDSLSPRMRMSEKKEAITLNACRLVSPPATHPATTPSAFLSPPTGLN